MDLYTGQHMSYEAIRDHLNYARPPMPGPEGRPWGVSTVVEMLRDNRLEQCAGYGFWNKQSRKTKGQKYNPRNQWTIVPNAHPAIITEDEMKAALSRKQHARAEAKYARTKESPYLFTGKNLEGKPMFTCALCGGNVIGERGGSTRHMKYVWGPNRYKGEIACTSQTRVDTEWLESTVLSMVRERYTAPDRLDSLVRQVISRLKESSQDYTRILNDLRQHRQKLEIEKQRLLDAIKAGMPFDFARTEIENANSAISDLDDQIDSLKANPPGALNVPPQEVRRFFSSLANSLDSVPTSEWKRLVHTFVRNLELDANKKEVRVSFYPDTSVFCLGVGSGT